MFCLEAKFLEVLQNLNSSCCDEESSSDPRISGPVQLSLPISDATSALEQDTGQGSWKLDTTVPLHQLRKATCHKQTSTCIMTLKAYVLFRYCFWPGAEGAGAALSTQSFRGLDWQRPCPHHRSLVTSMVVQGSAWFQPGRRAGDHGRVLPSLEVATSLPLSSLEEPQGPS